MLWRGVVDLVAVTQGQDAEGGPTETLSYREIFANEKSVRQSEFYQSVAIGNKPEFMLEINMVEYADEPKLRRDGVIYFITRTFSKNGEKLELTCSKYPMR